MARCYLHLWWYLLNCLDMTIFKYLLNWKHAVKWEISLKGTADTLKVWIKRSRSIGLISKYAINRKSWIHTQVKTYAVCFPKGLVTYLTNQPCVKAFSFLPVLQVCLLDPMGGGRSGQVGDNDNCSQNKHVGQFLYFKLPKLTGQVKSTLS